MTKPETPMHDPTRPTRLRVVAAESVWPTPPVTTPRQFSLPLQNAPADVPVPSSNPSNRLRRLLDIARRNELAWRRFQDLQLALMECEDLHEISACLTDRAQTQFDWASVHLHLADNGQALREAHDFAPSPLPPALHWLSEPTLLHRLWPSEIRPLLDRYRAQSHAAWLPGAAARGVESLALLPIVRRKIVLGVLAIGARSPGRFRPGMGTDFLEALTATLASCVEAAGSRALLKRLSCTDVLTGLGNRRHLEQRVACLSGPVGANAQSVACLIIDVDHFKRINDTFGHPAGDAVLQGLAARLRHLAPLDALVCRLGGEEFVALLHGHDLRGARDLAQTIRAGIAAEPIPGPSEPIPLTISCGVAHLSATEVAASPRESLVSTLLSRADRALYRAKRNGRDRVEVEGLNAD